MSETQRCDNVMTMLSDVATKIQPKPNVVTTSCASWEGEQLIEILNILVLIDNIGNSNFNIGNSNIRNINRNFFSIHKCLMKKHD